MGIYHRFLVSTIIILGSFFAFVSTACAETKELNFLLNSNGSESFEALVQQAQDLVKTTIEEEFAQHPEVSEVTIVLLSDRNGQIVPILRSKVSRSQWQQDSRIYRWTRLFNSSGVLLGFYNLSASLSPQPPADSISWRTRLENDPGYRND